MFLFEAYLFSDGIDHREDLLVGIAQQLDGIFRTYGQAGTAPFAGRVDDAGHLLISLFHFFYGAVSTYLVAFSAPDAFLFIDHRQVGLQRDGPFADQCIGLGRGGQRGGHGLRNVLGALAGATDVDTVHDRFDRTQFHVHLVEEAVGAHRQLQCFHQTGIVAGRHACHQHHQIGMDLYLFAEGEQIMQAHFDTLSVLPHLRLCTFCKLQKDIAITGSFIIEHLLFAVGTHPLVQVEGFDPRVIFAQPEGCMYGGRAAVTGTIGVLPFGLPAAYAINKGNVPYLFVFPYQFTGLQLHESLQLREGDHLLYLTVTELSFFRLIGVKARIHQDRAGLYGDRLLRLLQVDLAVGCFEAFPALGTGPEVDGLQGGERTVAAVIESLSAHEAEVERILHTFRACLYSFGKLLFRESLFYTPRLQGQGHLKVTHIAFYGRHTGPCEQRDILSCSDLIIEAFHDLVTPGFSLEHFAPLAGMTAHERLFLYEENLRTHTGQLQGSPHAGDAGTHYHSPVDGLDLHRFEVAKTAGFLDARFQQMYGLVRGLRRVVGMGPGALLPDVHLNIVIRVEAGTTGHIPEGHQMQLGRAGSHHHGIQTVLTDVLHHADLRGVGAGEHRGLHQADARVIADSILHSFHIHIVGDVTPTMADVHPDLFLLYGSSVLAHDILFKYLDTSAEVPPAETIVSGMSLGPAALPETKIPCRLVLAGFTNSSAWRMKRKVSRSMPSPLNIRSTSVLGCIPVARTTRSCSLLRRLPLSRSS